MAKAGSNAVAPDADSLDIDLLLRARDEVLRATEIGDALLTDLTFNSPEILQLVLIDGPDLMDRALNMLEVMQGPARSLLDGDGSEVITQAQMDSVQAFFDQLAAGVSDELNQILQTHLAKLGPFDKYVGMSVQEAFESIGGQTSTDIEHEVPGMSTDFVLEPTFPNPFHATSQIRYSLARPTTVTLAIYDIQGREVRTLLSGRQRDGVQSVTWNGMDDGGSAVPAGAYFVRLSTPTMSQSRKVVVVR